jgi:hypothetical protein
MTGRGGRLRSSRALALAAAVALSAAAAVGCGGAGKAAQDTGATSAKASAGDQDRGLLRFARCMREHGVDFPDPRRDASGQLVFDAPAGGDQAAQKACQRFVKGGFAGGPSDGRSSARAPSQAQVQKQLDQAVRFARCMRRNGVRSFPDPKTQGGQVLLDPGPGFDPNDPTRKRAVSKCRGLLDLGGSTAAP